jgi:hypothetical protein
MKGSLPLQDFPAGELEEGDQGVEDPVGEPLLIVQGGRALYRAHRRVAANFVQEQTLLGFRIQGYKKNIMVLRWLFLD